MPTPTTYTYSLSLDFPGGKMNSSKLQIAIQNSTIVTPLQEIDVAGNVVKIIFTDVLSVGDKTTLDGNTSHPAGGIIASTDNTPFLDNTLRYGILGFLAGANLNSTSDQSIYVQSTAWVLRRITCTNASGTVVTAIGGIYSGKSKTGTAIVPAIQTYAGLAVGIYKDLTLAAIVGSSTGGNNVVYFSLTTPEGSAKTCDIALWGDDLSP